MYNLHIQVHFQWHSYNAYKVRGLDHVRLLQELFMPWDQQLAEGHHQHHRLGEGEPAPRHSRHQVCSLPEAFKLSPRAEKQDTLCAWQLNRPLS